MAALCKSRADLLPALALLTTALWGCGATKYHPVVGRVTLDGDPVAGAAILFHPVQEGTVASGTTDADGRFDMMTSNHVGVPAGEYHVSVTKQRVSGVGADERAPGGVKVEWLIPERYSRPGHSGLAVTVPAPSLTYDFALRRR